MKPTSKVIQITSTERLNDVITTALCEDGSIWRYAKEWICILEPIEPKTESESDIKNNIKYIEDKVKAIKELSLSKQIMSFSRHFISSLTKNWMYKLGLDFGLLSSNLFSLISYSYLISKNID